MRDLRFESSTVTDGCEEINWISRNFCLEQYMPYVYMYLLLYYFSPKQGFLGK